jgi:hypothetical protein
MVVLRVKGEMGIIKSSFKTWTKASQIHHPDFREDSKLKLIKFRKLLFIYVIAKDVSFLTNLTSLNFEI